MEQKVPFLRTNEEMEAAKTIVDIMSNLDWTPKQKMDYLQKLHDQAGVELARATAQRDKTKQKIDCLTGLAAWVIQRPITIEKNECSRLHLLRQAAIDGNILFSKEDEHRDISQRIEHSRLMKMDLNSFVVKHDWSSALGAVEADSEIKLPYDNCAFEFKINGRPLIVIAIEHDGSMSLGPFMEVNGCWIYIEPEQEQTTVLQFAWDQIKAICIALDAEVATHHVERAPSNLNKKREAKGRVPLNDYHVVNLAKRYRIANPAGGSGEHGKKRLHFRRGHWRHYETTKTWVKWCLVGNPDLGFINKSYAL